MKRTTIMVGLASLAGAVVIAGSALAVPAVFSPTGHLNVRGGPGFQYPVVGQMPANARFPVTGCIQDYSWCSVTLANGVSGWASAPYLVTDAGGKPTNLQVSGAQLGIPIVVPTVAAVVAPPPVGAMIPTPALVQPIVPEPGVLSYVTQHVVDPVIVSGEVMVGAALPLGAPVYPIPNSPYVYSYINGQRVVVEPTARRIIYVAQP